jgi:hypothetical protein
MAKKTDPETNRTSTEGLQPLMAPTIHASIVQVSVSGNDVTLVLGRTHPAITQHGGMSDVATFEATGIVYLSPQTAKDLQTLLSTAISGWESNFGEIVTPHTKALRDVRK